MASLVITNGDTASDLLEAAGKVGKIVPWRDSLMEGPLPPLSNTRDIEVFSQTRAHFWAERGVGPVDQIVEDYQKRDRLLDDLKSFETIELWFEHDLYDQLQLIEILTRLYHKRRFDGVQLIQAERYLGMMSPDTILDLEPQALPVGERMMAIADLAFQCVSLSQPTKLVEFISLKPAGFLFLVQALRRLLEELPGIDGLSRTERQMLYSLNRGINKPGMLFARCQAMEEAQFWGDWGFFHVLSGLQFCKRPLITGLPEPVVIEVFRDEQRRKNFLQSSLTLTKDGTDVLAGRVDHALLNFIDRHVGGTHLTNGHLWRWDGENSALLAPDAVRH